MREFFAMYVRNDPEMYEFGGPFGCDHVEIDESKFGKCKITRGHRGKKVEGVWVFGFVECWLQPDGSYKRGKIIAYAVKKRNKRTLIPIIMRHVLPGTHIISDYWKAYDCIDDPDDIAGDMFYTHGKVNHSKEFMNADFETTNMIEGSWKWMKDQIPQQAFNSSAIQDHLFEFTWRANHSGHIWSSFIEALAQIKYNPNVGYTLE